MASIQIHELRPVEVRIEELSYDTTDSIRGGSLSAAELGGVNSYFAFELLVSENCTVGQALGNFWERIALEFSDQNDIFNKNYVELCV